MGLIITFCLGIFFIVGALIVKYSKNKENLENISISVALGTMIMLIFLDFIPEIKEKSINILTSILFILLGIIVLKILDLFIPEHDDKIEKHKSTKENLVHIGIVSLIAIALHNILEGMSVYSMSEENIREGLLVALGVGLHNIPMGMIIYTTLEYEKKSKKILSYIICILSTFIGGIIMFSLGTINQALVGTLLCLTLGMIIYIALFELIPNIIHSDNKKDSLIGIIIGILIVLISISIE